MIDNNRTPAGAWTKAQLAILGVKWPPIQGWIGRVKGKRISRADAERFAALGRAGPKKPRRWTADDVLELRTALERFA